MIGIARLFSRHPATVPLEKPSEPGDPVTRSDLVHLGLHLQSQNPAWISSPWLKQSVHDFVKRLATQPNMEAEALADNLRAKASAHGWSSVKQLLSATALGTAGLALCVSGVWMGLPLVAAALVPAAVCVHQLQKWEEEKTFADQVGRLTPWFERQRDAGGPINYGTIPTVFGPERPRSLHEVVEAREAVYRQQLGKQAGACVVGVLCHEGQAASGMRGSLGAYIDSILKAGGEPRLIYPSRGDYQKQMAGIHSLLIPGGADIHPSFYGQPVGSNMKEEETAPEFDRFELQCIQKAYAENMPMLGICRGLQLMNVAGGGTLVQDIPTEWKSPKAINHRNLNGNVWKGTQKIKVAKGSRLANLLGTLKIGVNSLHHQCIAQLSPQLFVTALAMDNVIEAVERKGNPTQMAVQFHPELLADERFTNLFTDLVHNGLRHKHAMAQQ